MLKEPDESELVTKDHSKSHLAVILLLFLLTLLIWPMRASAASSEVQVAYTVNVPPSTTFHKAFGSSVTSGDLLVALVGTYATGVTYSVTDSPQNNLWSPGGSDCTNYCVEVFYAQASSSGSDTVYFTASSDPNSDYIYGFIAEFSGTSYLGKASVGTTGSCPSSTSFTPESGSAVLNVAVDQTAGWSHGTGFNMMGSNTGWSAASEWDANWGGSSTTAPWAAPCSGVFDQVAESFAPTGTNLISCAASSAPKGILVTGTNVWMGLSGSGKIGLSSTTTCMTTAYSGKNDPTYIGAFGNGNFAFTQKTASNSCISTWNPSAKSVTASYCAGSGVGFDDVATDPTNSGKVWTTEYYNAALVEYTSAGSATVHSIPYSSAGCTSSNPEGVRVDNSGNVWVADENSGCGLLWKYTPSTSTWSHTGLYLSGTQVYPWFLAYDGTNGVLWISSSNFADSCNLSNCIIGAAFKYTISSGSLTDIHQPSYYTIPSSPSPLGIAVDPNNNRVYVAFQGGSIGVYWTGSSPLWLCNILTPGGSSGNPWDVNFNGPNFYWATLYGNNQVVYGVC